MATNASVSVSAHRTAPVGCGVPCRERQRDLPTTSLPGRELETNPKAVRMMKELNQKLGAGPTEGGSEIFYGCGGVHLPWGSGVTIFSAGAEGVALFRGHPKLEKLEAVLLEHFSRAADNSRAMVFSTVCVWGVCVYVYIHIYIMYIYTHTYTHRARCSST